MKKSAAKGLRDGSYEIIHKSPNGYRILRNKRSGHVFITGRPNFEEAIAIKSFYDLARKLS